MLHSSLSEKDAYARMDSIHRRTVFPLPDSVAKEFEQLDDEICASMDYVERKCQVFHTGGEKFSLAYKAATQTVEYWTRHRGHELGFSRNARKLIKPQRKLQLVHNPALTILEILDAVGKARKKKENARNEPKVLSIEYRHRLAAAKEEAGQGKAATILRGMNGVEAQRTQEKNVKCMLGKTKGGSLNQVTVTNPDGSHSDLMEQQDVEAAVIMENEWKYHQTEGDRNCWMMSSEWISVPLGKALKLMQC